MAGAAGGLGGFFPPLVMALVKSLTSSYTLGFILFAAVAILFCWFSFGSSARSRRHAVATHSEVQAQYSEVASDGFPS